MQEAENTKNLRIARVIRGALLLGIAVLLVFTWQAVRQDETRSANPMVVGPAHAAGVSAAPGFLMFPIENVAGQSRSKIVLADTTRQVLCVYQLVNERIRLTGVREFDADTDIVDASVDVVTEQGRQIKSFEGGNGATRPEAMEYSKALKEMMKAAEQK